MSSETSSPSSTRNSELLFRLDEKVSEILRRMDGHEASISKLSATNELAHDSFDNRLKALENFRWWFLGVGAATGFATNIIKDWIMKGLQ